VKTISFMRRLMRAVPDDPAESGGGAKPSLGALAVEERVCSCIRAAAPVEKRKSASMCWQLEIETDQEP